MTITGKNRIMMDASSNIYVADTNNDRIQVFDSSGAFLFQLGSFGSGDGQFKGPIGVAVDYCLRALIPAALIWRERSH